MSDSDRTDFFRCEKSQFVVVANLQCHIDTAPYDGLTEHRILIWYEEIGVLVIEFSQEWINQLIKAVICCHGHQER